MLVAVGRRPYTAGLGLDELGVEARQARPRRGRRAVPQTNVPGVYAIGDVIAGPMLAHKAEEEGVACAEMHRRPARPRELRRDPERRLHRPEVAARRQDRGGVAEGKGVEYRIGKFPFLANGRASAMDETDGFVKVLADAKTDRVLGVHILGPRAGDLIAEAALAMEFGAQRRGHRPHLPRPSDPAEAVKEAALAVAGRSIHI